MYSNGKGVPQDDREAVRWYRQAAEQGNADAQYNLGLAYANGEGVPQNDREAVKWYRRAADQGNAYAQSDFGAMYTLGRGVPQDDREAVKWYRRAAEQGNAVAQGALGAMYTMGKGVIQDDREAYIWLSLAVVSGLKDTAKFRDNAANRLSLSQRASAQAEAKQRLKAIDARREGQAPEAPQHAQAHSLLAPLTPVTPPTAAQSPAQRAFEHGWRSVVVVTTSDGQGSGVIVRPNVVATNCHVVDGDEAVTVYRAAQRRAQKDTPYTARVRRADDDHDLCLLDVTELWGVPAQIRKAGSLSIGEAVYAIGAPRGLDYSLSAGVVSQLRRNEDDDAGAPVIQTDATIAPGSSGGGLFDASGNLVGITTLKMRDSDIAFAIPAEWILEMP